MDILAGGRPEGIEAAAKIHSDYHVPVVFLTGRDDGQKLERSTPAGPMAYLLKPFSPAGWRSGLHFVTNAGQSRRILSPATFPSMTLKCSRPFSRLNLLDGTDPDCFEGFMIESTSIVSCRGACIACRCQNVNILMN